MEKVEESTLESLMQLWNFQLIVVDGQPVTIGKVVLGVVFAIIGFFIAQTLSKQIGKKFISRINIDASRKYTLERAVFYVLYIFVVLFVLQLVSIPLTIFTFVGGALAIGIGFGSQNIVNNFISGLIVMVAQPLKVMDWIEIDGIYGQVESIGSRSTILRTGDNKHMIIPNSHFLEKVFTNWTYEDSAVQGKLSVGVGYGSNTALVKQLLLQAAANHPSVMRSPAPAVAFVDFGESSLNFNLSFSVMLDGNVTPKGVASDLRFVIFEQFNQNKIEFPYPHREIIMKGPNV